jgi:hypothetical protein
MMQLYGRSNLSEFLGNRVVYRNLIPQDERIPSLDEISNLLDLSNKYIPRKSEINYAKVIVQMLKHSRMVDLHGGKIERLIFVGDTRLNDGNAFANICQVGEWPGKAFIGSESSIEPAVEILELPGARSLYIANRWSALNDFEQFCKTSEFPIDEKTVVIIDLDKTAIGARGRNAHVIDRARVDAIQETVSSLLGKDFDKQEFVKNYQMLNQVEFHPFTTDNQDYLAYICMILGSGLYDLERLIQLIEQGVFQNFVQFITEVNEHSGQLSARLVSIHTEIHENVQLGDPTPFKPFRRNEYLKTVGRMGHLADNLPVASYLEDEIVITQEVRSITARWRKSGALLFGLSDKPDEASIPTLNLTKQGYLPIHQTITHVVGLG